MQCGKGYTDHQIEQQSLTVNQQMQKQNNYSKLLHTYSMAQNLVHTC